MLRRVPYRVAVMTLRRQLAPSFLILLEETMSDEYLCQPVSESTQFSRIGRMAFPMTPTALRPLNWPIPLSTFQ